ncbi:MAG: hypothetical protein QXE07_03730, partial [Thermoplasmata archaeon]
MDTGTIVPWVLFGIALIIAVVFLILWLTKKTEPPAGSELFIRGLTFAVQGSTLVATWTSTTSPTDQVTMYTDTKQVDLNTTGMPTSTTVLRSNTVNGSVGRLEIPGLITNTTYFATVVVTDGTKYIHENKTINTSGIPVGNFTIQEIHSTGGITLNATNGTVTYETTPKKSVDDLWTYDGNTFKLRPSMLVGGMPGSMILYNNNGTLAAGSEGTQNVTAANSEWTYNTTENSWCLRATP